LFCVATRALSHSAAPSASATGTNRDQLVILFLPQAVPAGALLAPHAFDGRYSNVENRLASPPDRLWSRIKCGRDTRDESCRSVALRRGAKAARKEHSWFRCPRGSEDWPPIGGIDIADRDPS